MNRDQIKYVTERAQSMYNSKRQSLIKQFTTPAVTLTDFEKLEALRDGSFSIKENAGRFYYLNDVIEFPQERLQVIDSEGLDKASTQLSKVYNKLMDELMLGDSEQALQMLKEFEKFE